MVGFKSKEKRLCGGKLIVTNFKRLNQKDFPAYDNLMEELAVFSPDGKAYVNTKMWGCDLVSGIFEVLIQESKGTLKKLKKEFSEKYPRVKDFDSWGEWAKSDGCTDNKEITESLAMLLIPIELKRREIEAGYYGKNLAFPH